MFWKCSYEIAATLLSADDYASNRDMWFGVAANDCKIVFLVFYYNIHNITKGWRTPQRKFEQEYFMLTSSYGGVEAPHRACIDLSS